MIARRKPLRRLTPLRPGGPIRRKHPLPRSRKPLPRRRATERRIPPEYHDPDYLEWLRLQNCRALCCSSVRIEPHHARHDEHGQSLGAHMKDDRRVISMCRQHHEDLHALAGQFKNWDKQRLHEWIDQQIAIQRAEYLRAREQ